MDDRDKKLQIYELKGQLMTLVKQNCIAILCVLKF